MMVSLSGLQANLERARKACEDLPERPQVQGIGAYEYTSHNNVERE